MEPTPSSCWGLKTTGSSTTPIQQASEQTPLGYRLSRTDLLSDHAVARRVQSGSDFVFQATAFCWKDRNPGEQRGERNTHNGKDSVRDIKRAVGGIRPEIITSEDKAQLILFDFRRPQYAA
ncbi:MAG: hypothetical protein M2R45_00121 [Verrucomicrobia subdivision 3 bacterium]|nr:hypothetical protein [Limisphaerales bacterium]MCS1412419.1 hypothetical protein [Limisphaerales bacterium]